MMAKNLEQILGKRGAQKARRILSSEYQKYLIDCLKHSKKDGLPFEKWLQTLNKKSEKECPQF